MTEVQIALETECAGWFKLEAISPDGSVRVVADWFPNLITDQGLNYLGTSNSFMQYCQVGTGSAVPAVSDVALQTFVASSNFIVSSSSPSSGAVSPYWGAERFVYQFNTGVAAGNLTEVGVGESNLPGDLFSRALILDGGGLPTTITILVTEILQVTYEFRTYSPLTDVTGTFLLSGVSYGYTARAAFSGAAFYWGAASSFSDITNSYNSNLYDGLIGTLLTSPAGNVYAYTGYASGVYGANNFYKDNTFVWGIAATPGPVAVKSVLLHMHSGVVQIQFGTTIPKTVLNELTLVVRYAWARRP